MNVRSKSITLVAAIGGSHERFQQLARSLKERTGVRGVAHWFDVFDDGAELNPAFRVEEYVSADLSDGRSIDWCLELSGYHDAGNVRLSLRADIRRYNEARDETRDPIAEQTLSNVTEFTNALG